MQRDLFVARSDGSDLRQITNDAFNDFWPRWSPMGGQDRVLYGPVGSYQLWTINPDAAVPGKLTRASSSLLQTIWSSDGSRLAYTRDGQTRSFIMVLDRPWDEQSPVELPALSDGEDSFAVWSWSPDGQWLAERDISWGDPPHNRGVYVFSLETEQYERLTRTVGVHAG